MIRPAKGRVDATIERPIPMTYERAATALVQGDGHLERAIGDLRLAIRILAELSEGGTFGNGDGPPASFPPDRLEAVVEELEAAERVLRKIRRPEIMS